jgi:tellurite resistance protein TehA-like permease
MKNTALKFINPILFMLVLTTFIAMLLSKFGPESMRGSEDLSVIHTWAGTLFFIVGTIHLIYNWGWVRTNIIGKRKKHK